MISYLLVFLLFILPFVVLPIGVSPFENSKVILAELAIEAILIISIWQKRLSNNLLKNHFSYILGGLFLLTLISLFFFPSSTTFFGNPFRLQGVFLYWHLFILAILMQKVKLPKLSPIFYLAILLLMLISTVILGTDQNARFVSTLGEANSLAATAIFLWPFLYFSPIIPKLSITFSRLISIICAALIIILSGSRSGVVAFVLQLAFIFFTSKIKMSVKSSVTLILIIMALSLFLPFIEGGGWYQNRAEVWKTALYAGSVRPIFGNGFGNIEQVLPKISKYMGNNLQYEYVDSSHNILLDFWVQGGFFGVFFLVLLLYQTFKTFTLQFRVKELVLLLGVLTVMMFNPVSVVVLVYLWFLLSSSI